MRIVGKNTAAAVLLVSMVLCLTCHKKSEVLVSQEINNEQGGVVETPDGALRITIPPYSLSQSATLTIASLFKPPAAENKPYLAAVGDCYSVTLSAGHVVDTIEVSFSYTDLNLPADAGVEDLYPAYYDSTKNCWVRLGSTLDTTAKRFWVRVMHLSDWQIRAYTAKQHLVSVWTSEGSTPPSASLLSDRPYISAVCLPCTVAGPTHVSPVLQTVEPGAGTQVRLITLFFKGSSDDFLAAYGTPANRQAFLDAAVSRVSDYDGLDIDMENWSVTNALRYVALIHDLRSALTSEKILSVTAQVSHFPLEWLLSVLGWVDEFRVMAYDHHIPGSTGPGPSAPYDAVSADVDLFAGPAGIFKKRILLGIPLHYYQWTPDQSGGLLSALDAAVAVTASRTQATPGDNVDLHINIGTSPAVEWNSTSKTPSFLTLDGRQVNTENVRSISCKMKLAESRGIRGVCFWHYVAGDGDARSGPLWDAISKYDAGALAQPGDPSADDLGVLWTVVDPNDGTQTLDTRNSNVTWTVPSGLNGVYKLTATLPADPTEIAASSTVEINVTGGGSNNPPNTPSVPAGPASGTVGTSYDFTSSAADPDGDDVAIRFDWGSGDTSAWSSYVSSGSSVTMSHAWATAGTYNVKAQAKDEHSSVSGWSTGHSVVVSGAGSEFPDTVVSTISVGSTPQGVAALANGQYVYVANTDGNNVSVIRTSDNAVVSTVPTDSSPWGLAALPNSGYVYVTNEWVNSVSVIRVSDNVVTTTVPVGNCPLGLAVLPNGSFVYVALNHDNSVAVIRSSDNTVVATIPLEFAPWGVTALPDGQHVYVVGGTGNAAVIQTSDNSVAATMTVGYCPMCVAALPSGDYVYITNSGFWPVGNTVSVVRTSDNTEVATVTVGGSPRGVTALPNGEYVYVANWEHDTVSVIRTSDNVVVRSIIVGSYPDGIAVHPSGDYVYVTSSSGTVSVIGFRGGKNSGHIQPSPYSLPPLRRRPMQR